MPDVQEAYEKISAETAEPCPYPASRSGVQVDGEDVGWRSPRMMLALAQAGAEPRELWPQAAGRFESQARKEGLKDWKSVAQKREAAAEKQRSRLVVDVVQLRQTLIESGSKGLEKGPSPENRSKEAEAAMAAETKRALNDQKLAMERVMASQAERFEKEKKIHETAAKLKLEREEASALVAIKFEEKKAAQVKEMQQRRKAALEWELNRQAKQVLEEKIMHENGVKAMKAMEERDIEIVKKQEAVRKEAAKIGVRFRAERAKKLANIKAANRKKEEELVKIAAESLVKQEESEKVRAEKLRVKEAIVKQENAERTAVAKKRLEAHEHSLVVEEEKKKAKAEKKFAVVEVRLAKKKVKQDEEIAAARKRAADAAAGRGEMAEARERVRAQQQQVLRDKAVLADKHVQEVVERKDRQVEMKIVESQLVFAEKREAIKRIQRRHTFEHEQKVKAMESFLDRTVALDKARAKALNQRKEAARTALLKCRRLREEDAEVRAKEDKKQYIQLNQSLMNMSNASFGSRPGSAASADGTINQSRSKEELEEFFDKIATPIQRKGPDGEEGPPPRPGSAGYVNHITLRTHWAHMDRAPSTTWGDLEKQVYGGPHHSVSVYDKL